MFYPTIEGCGAYVPQKIMTNDELSKTIDTNDEWIRSRTGICQRHIAHADEHCSDLACEAARDALADAGISSDQLDLIIVATTTADQIFPSVATIVQSRLDAHCPAFDIQAVCAGFIYALNMAEQSIRTGQSKHVLVIGAETMSRIIDWKDRRTAVLFGDGAGAVVLSANAQDSIGRKPQRGIIASDLHADGRLKHILQVPAGISTKQHGYICMEGKEVFKHAVDKMSRSILNLLEKSGHTIDDVNHLIPHQANSRILDAVAKRIQISPEKVVTTVDKHANTSAASIPLALHHAVDQNRIQRGDLVVLEALGAGLCWGGAVLRW